MSTLDLGSGFSLRFFGWAPDRELNPQYDDVLDVEKAGATIICPHGEGGIHFVIPAHRLFQDGWTVDSWEPLTLSPSIHRLECGCHGFIREGKWVAA